MELFIDAEWKTLLKGEEIRFNANQAHGYQNTTSNIASFQDVIHYPKQIQVIQKPKR